MAITVTTWRPDTCGCVLSYAWDTAADPATRAHTPVSFDASQCGVHAGLGLDLAAGHTRVLDENPRKNKLYDRAVQWCAANAPSMIATDAEGNQHLVAGSWAFSYDPTGLLTVSLPLLTAAQKTQIQQIANSQFGAGKVKVV